MQHYHYQQRHESVRVQDRQRRCTLFEKLSESESILLVNDGIVGYSIFKCSEVIRGHGQFGFPPQSPPKS